MIDGQEVGFAGQYTAPAIEGGGTTGNNQSAVNSGCVASEPFSDGRVETHHAYRTVIAFERLDDRARQHSRIAAPTLHFDQQRRLAARESQQLGKGGDVLAAVEQPLSGKHVGGSGFHGQRGCAHAPQVMVVENDDLSVSGQSDIAFDARSDFERASKGGKTVFRYSRSMESAMREPHWPGI